MTRDEILNMPSGREMDILIAEKVMKLVPCDAWELFHWSMSGGEYIHHPEICNFDNKCYPKNNCPQYSNNISAAWEVVEKMNTFFGKTWAIFDETLGEMQPLQMMSESEASLTICRAALLAVMEE